MQQDYKVRDPQQGWNVQVTLESTDVEIIHTLMTTPQIVQICKDKIEESVRIALAEQFSDDYEDSMKIDVDKLDYLIPYERTV